MAATTPRLTNMLMAGQPPFTAGLMCPPRDFSPLAPLRASRNMSSCITSTVKTPSKTAPTPTDTMATLPSPSASRPPLDTSPVPSTDIRDSSGSGTGRTRGLRPASPLPQAFHAATHGPPPHLRPLAPVWDSLDHDMQAQMRLVSLRDVEEGIEHARTTADQHALDLAIAKHERLLLPLRTKAVTLDSSSEATRAGIRDTARTLKEY